MAYNLGKDSAPGFIFDGVNRAEFLKKEGITLPKARKTGTTIAGLCFKDGVVLGADTRATEDTTVSDKNCVKIHYLLDNMFCCGAGTAADTEMTTKLISSQLKLHQYYTGREVPTRCAKQMLKQLLFRYQGHIGAALVLGGMDDQGPSLYSIYPHGSTDKLPYTAMGSGTMAAMAHFEKHFKVDMSEEEAKQLVRDAIAGGIFNDLGSGSNVDLCILRKTGTEYIRTYEMANKKGERQNRYVYPKGASTVLKEKLQLLDIEEHVEHISPDDLMEVST